MAKFDETFSQKMEKTRTPMLGLLGRHFIGGKFPTDGAKAVDKNVGGLRKFWDGCKSKEIPTSSYQGGKPPRVYSGFQTWNSESVAGSVTQANARQKCISPPRDPLASEPRRCLGASVEKRRTPLKKSWDSPKKRP